MGVAEQQGSAEPGAVPVVNKTEASAGSSGEDYVQEHTEEQGGKSNSDPDGASRTNTGSLPVRQ